MHSVLSRNKALKQHDYCATKKKEEVDTKTLGDILAVTIIVGYTLLALLASTWSAFLLITGRMSGGPIEFIINKLATAGIL